MKTFKDIRQEKFAKFKEDASSKGYEIKCISDAIYLYARYIVGQCVEKNRRNNFSIKDGWLYKPIETKSAIDKDIELSIYRNKIYKTLDKWYYDFVRGNEAFSGIAPSSVAASLAYVALLVNGDATTQRDISEISGVSNAAIQNNYKKFRQMDLQQTVSKMRN